MDGPCEELRRFLGRVVEAQASVDELLEAVRWEAEPYSNEMARRFGDAYGRTVAGLEALRDRLCTTLWRPVRQEEASR